jgi:hypothetical protein
MAGFAILVVEHRVGSVGVGEAFCLSIPIQNADQQLER